jgi:AcrR family transcriptional regulator
MADRTTSSTDPRVRRSRERIIPAAISRFAANGYTSVNMDEIAEAAGVSGGGRAGPDRHLTADHEPAPVGDR